MSRVEYHLGLREELEVMFGFTVDLIFEKQLVIPFVCERALSETTEIFTSSTRGGGSRNSEQCELDISHTTRRGTYCG